jgi:hypothetical protein
VPDLLAHGAFDVHHPGPQSIDFAADLVYSVVHGSLEQK